MKAIIDRLTFDLSRDVLKKSLFVTLHKNIIDHTYQHGLIKLKQMKKL